MAFASPSLECKVKAAMGEDHVCDRGVVVRRPWLVDAFTCWKRCFALLACLVSCGSASASCLSNPLFAHDHVVLCG
jgi:hypothetical protein